MPENAPRQPGAASTNKPAPTPTSPPPVKAAEKPANTTKPEAGKEMSNGNS